MRALAPTPDSHFLTSGPGGRRATGGLFSLDGVHPTTVGYGLLAQEMINVMAVAGVTLAHPDGGPRADHAVDFDRLIGRDTLINTPPPNLDSTLSLLGRLDDTLGWAGHLLGIG